MITQQVMAPVAAQDEIEALDREIKAAVYHLKALIDKRDAMMAKYVLRPLQIGEVI